MKYRLAQVVEWDRSGQFCIALILGKTIVARFSDWQSARAAYKAVK